MEVDDLLFIQDYFKSIGRVPARLSLRCWIPLLTTVVTQLSRLSLKNIDFSVYLKTIAATAAKYGIAMRDELGRTEKNLKPSMDMATIFGRYEACQ